MDEDQITARCAAIAAQIRIISSHRSALVARWLDESKPYEHALFGTASRQFGHRFVFEPPLTLTAVIELENRYGIRLPEQYRSFLMLVSGGGAGPYYGLNTPADWAEHYELTPTVLQRALSAPCLLRDDFAERTRVEMGLDPGADVRSTDEWLKFIGSEANEEAWNADEWSPYFGTLCLSDQGCTFCSVLILNGEYTGRTCHIALDRYIPVFDSTGFLDWYEHWVDGVLQVVATL